MHDALLCLGRPHLLPPCPPAPASPPARLALAGSPWCRTERSSSRGTSRRCCPSWQSRACRPAGGRAGPRLPFRWDVGLSGNKQWQQWQQRCLFCRPHPLGSATHAALLARGAGAGRAHRVRALRWAGQGRGRGRSVRVESTGVQALWVQRQARRACVPKEPAAAALTCLQAPFLSAYMALRPAGSTLQGRRDAGARGGRWVRGYRSEGRWGNQPDAPVARMPSRRCGAAGRSPDRALAHILGCGSGMGGEAGMGERGAAA